MLFTTSTFILLFLPLTLVGFYLLGRHSAGAAALWLLLASLAFYAHWMPVMTALLLLSIVTNFQVGRRIAVQLSSGHKVLAKRWLLAGIVFNLGLLGYFKYVNFFIGNLNQLLGMRWDLATLVLPVGISFYSFTQIAYLVDTWSGKVNEVRPVHYGLFVTYFPHLVAGPVLHHAQMMPQFAQASVYRFQPVNFFAGLAILALGLFKKVVLADGVAPYADAVFNPVDEGAASPLAMEAWLAALAYTFQLYFDFSAYSDMAIGLSWMFNIRLPFNFNSPYRARSISDFWRRWHISLSTFLRDYLYVPLGGNRKGPVRRFMNLAATMVLGGLWHGASWSFVLWGTLHGAYLMLNHGFRALCERFGLTRRLEEDRFFGLLSWALTFTVVVLAWVFFRATTLDGALRMLAAMFGHGGADGESVLLWNAGLPASTGWAWCAALAALAWLFPNSNRFGEWVRQAFEVLPDWRYLGAGFAGLVVLLLVIVNQFRTSVSAFIYFNF